MKSGIWVEAEKAKDAALNMLESKRLNAWRDYRRYLKRVRNNKIHWLWGLTDQPAKKPNSFKKIMKEANRPRDMFSGTKKQTLQFWRAAGSQYDVCQDVIRACNVPPADGMIFLTLNDVRSIGL